MVVFVAGVWDLGLVVGLCSLDKKKEPLQKEFFCNLVIDIVLSFCQVNAEIPFVSWTNFFARHMFFIIGLCVF